MWSAHAQTGDQLLRSAHVRYSAPLGWTVEDFPDHRGTFMYAHRAPDDAPASIGIELSSSPERNSIQEVLERFIASPNAKGVVQRDFWRTFGKTRGGVNYGRVEFSQERNGIRSIESFTVLPLRTGLSVFVYTSIVEADYPKYARTTSEFLESLTVPE
jgi:hypothetical protein